MMDEPWIEDIEGVRQRRAATTVTEEDLTRAARMFLVLAAATRMMSAMSHGGEQPLRLLEGVRDFMGAMVSASSGADAMAKDIEAFAAWCGTPITAAAEHAETVH